IVVVRVGVVDAAEVLDGRRCLSDELQVAQRRPGRPNVEDDTGIRTGDGAVLDDVIGARGPRAPRSARPFAGDAGPGVRTDTHALEGRVGREVRDVYAGRGEADVEICEPGSRRCSCRAQAGA